MSGQSPERGWKLERVRSGSVLVSRSRSRKKTLPRPGRGRWRPVRGKLLRPREDEWTRRWSGPGFEGQARGWVAGRRPSPRPLCAWDPLSAPPLPTTPVPKLLPVGRQGEFLGVGSGRREEAHTQPQFMGTRVSGRGWYPSGPPERYPGQGVVHFVTCREQEHRRERLFSRAQGARVLLEVGGLWSQVPRIRRLLSDLPSVPPPGRASPGVLASRRKPVRERPALRPTGLGRLPYSLRRRPL